LGSSEQITTGASRKASGEVDAHAAVGGTSPGVLVGMDVVSSHGLRRALKKIVRESAN